MSRRAARRLLAAGIWLGLLYISYVVLPYYFHQDLFLPLAAFLQGVYGFFYDIVFGAGQTGWWLAAILLFIGGGLLVHGLATEAGIVVILMFTWGLATVGPLNTVEYTGGRLVSVREAEVLGIGRGIAAGVGAVIGLVVVAQLFAFGSAFLVPVALGAGVSGYHYDKWKRMGKRPMQVLLALVLVPPILEFMWHRWVEFESRSDAQQVAATDAAYAMVATILLALCGVIYFSIPKKVPPLGRAILAVLALAFLAVIGQGLTVY